MILYSAGTIGIEMAYVNEIAAKIVPSSAFSQALLGGPRHCFWHAGNLRQSLARRFEKALHRPKMAEQGTLAFGPEAVDVVEHARHAAFSPELPVESDGEAVRLVAEVG